MKNFKTMVAILIMATAGVSLAATSETTYDAEGNITGTSSTTAGENSGVYESGAFNFTEVSDQNISSNISGSATVYGDTKTSSGDVIQIENGGIYSSGENSGYSAGLTTQSGLVTGQSATDATIGGHFVTIEVPVYTYKERFSPTFLAKASDVVAGIDFNGDGDFSDPQDVAPVVEGQILGGISLGFLKTQTVNGDGVPQTKPDTHWVAYNATEASLIMSNNNLAAQKIAANANTTQTVNQNSTSNSTQTIKSAPSMGAPSINASNSDMCRHGVSAAASMIGMGFSGGVTLIDKNCELLKQVRLLSNLGLSDVALALLGQDDRVAKAMFQADPERYSQFLNSETVRDLEVESANAEAVVNGEDVKYQNADADQVIIDQSREGSDDNKQAKDLGANGFPTGDLLNLPIFNWLN